VRISRTTLKVFRDIRRSRWQFFAVAAVIALGVAIFIGSYGSFLNLRSSYDRTYDELAMGDLWFDVADAPSAVVADAGAIDGVMAAEGRLVVDLPATVPAIGEGPIQARVITTPGDGRPAVNDVKVTEGDYFTGPGQVLLEQGFADFNDVAVGDVVQLQSTDGTTSELTVVGHAVSPEYLFVARSERELFTPPASFGVMFVPYDDLAATLGTAGRINSLSLRLDPDADAAAISHQVSALLEPYGLGAAYDRDDQLSNQLLQLDLDGFESLALVFPILFLAVSSLAIYSLLNRLVQSQRGQIGLMRAMGYSRGQVLRHYLNYGLIIGTVAAAVGVGLGYAIATLLTRAYGNFLTVPFISTQANPGVLAIGFAAGLTASLIAAAIPAWLSAGIRPAEAMRPPAPPAGRHLLIERLLPPLKRLPNVLKLPLRNIWRVPSRTVYTAFGMAAGVSLVLVAASFLDSYDRAIDLQFDRIQNYDARVNFVEPFPTSLVDEVDGIEGVRDAEPLMEVPVELSIDGVRHATLLQGLEPGGGLLRVYTPDGDRLEPANGLLITTVVANLLGVEKGDSVNVRPVTPGAQALSLTVDDIAQQPMGDVVFARLDTAQALAGDQPIASALLVSFSGDPTPALESQLYALDGAGSIDFTSDIRDYLDELNALFLVFIGVMLVFGVALGFAIIFNTITINALERRRELATMRTFGTGIGRLAFMLTVENAVMGVIGVGVGLPIGYALAQYFAQFYQNDLFDMPVVIYTRTYAIAAVGALIVLLLAEIPAVRFVRRLDLPAVVREIAT
jgi:putative ABC transport system permease protein